MPDLPTPSTGAYRTAAARSEAELREKGSRFIALAQPASDEAQARAAVAQARAAFGDATHHCWAWRAAGAAGGVERSDDAGEPAGTAGPPILQAIRGADLWDVVVVVVRYFGGTKLGKGGLARAYRAAARAALERVPVRAVVPQVLCRVRAPIAHDGALRHLLARHGARLEDARYDEPACVELAARCPAANVVALSAAIDDLTRGAAEIRLG